MNILFILTLFKLLINVIQSKDCGPCNYEDCEHPGKCLAGYVKDSCGCCWICGQKEGDFCSDDKLQLPYKDKYAVCGKNLECKLRPNSDPYGSKSAVCVCKFNEVICGTDKKTYTNLCHMMEEANRKFTTIKKLHKGPCNPAQEPRDCGECNEDLCPRPIDCLAGVIKDSCGCCQVCGRREGELCDNPQLQLPYKNKYGTCGDNLECKIRTDLAPTDSMTALCVCKYKDVICGTDENTYTNLCKLMEEAYRTRTKIKIQHRGPCKSVPWIVSPPEDSTNKTGENVAFSCEVMGFPVPIVDWQFGTEDSNIQALPGDEQRIAVQSRGGPEQYEVTSWIQIQGLTQKDDGMYTCIAKNEMGEVRASARLVILPSE